MKEGVKKERRRVRREWCGKNWKWVVPCIVAGLILAIVMCCLSIPLLVSRVKQQIMINELKECSGTTISRYITELVVPSYRCNSEKMNTLDLSLFPQLKSIVIGDDCFMYVKEVKLIGLGRLERVVIGENSFTKEKSDNDKNASGLYVKSCELLRELKIGNHSFEEYSACEIENVPSLKVIEVGDDCFANVNEVKLVGMDQLERVVIGKNSFTKNKNSFGNDPYRHFYLKDCERLRELKMGRYSFSDYSVCEIENDDSLEVIEMGELNEDSWNFRYASLELKSDSQRMK